MLEKRALTHAQKQEIVERLLAAWLRAPQQRLGQLLVNAQGDSGLFGINAEGGYVPLGTAVECPKCGGRGEVERDDP